VSWWRSSKSSRLDDRGRPNARRRALARARNARLLDEFGEPVGGPARPDDPAVVLMRFAWRWRRELGPFYVLLALTTIAGIGNLYAPSLWPLALPLGAAVTAALWRWKTDRQTERAYVLAVGAAGTLWAMLAWWASPGHGWFAVTGLAGAVAGGIPHWLHYRWRGNVTAKRGASRAIRRETRRVVKAWPELADYMQLAGSHAQRAEADVIGYSLTLALRAGLTSADVMGNLHRVESVLKTPPGAARLMPDPKRADRVFLRIVRHDPLATPIPWPGATGASINEPITLGQFEDGEPVRFALPGGHVLIGGATGRGKSGVLNVILAELAPRGDVVLWGVDMKRGLELAPWRRVLGRLAITDDEALETLTAANRVLDGRAAVLAERGERKWQPRADAPALLVLVDELAELGPEAMAQLERLARLGRAAGIIVVTVTQRPSAEALGGLDARTQMTTRIALGVTEARDGELILGTGRVGAGWRAERLTEPGYFLALVLGVYDQPRPARAYLLDDDAVRAVVARTAARRPSLDPESADAARRPQEQSQLTRSERERADVALLTALDSAPPDGLSAGDLAARVGRSRAWVFSQLNVHATAGRAVRLGRGRWAARRGTPTTSGDDA
jgi:DNA segregation ATPase FtsK/SpoIIIE, S-DNA-T family